MKISKRDVYRWKEVAGSIRKNHANVDFYGYVSDRTGVEEGISKEERKRLSQNNVNDICLFIENIPYLKTEHPNIFKNEEWHTLFHVIQGIWFEDTSENRKFIYYAIKYAPLPFKIKFKYWLFKKVLYRFFSRIYNIFKIFITPPNSEKFKYDYESVQQPRISSISVGSSEVKPQEKTRTWKWVDSDTEKQFVKEPEKDVKA